MYQSIKLMIFDLDDTLIKSFIDYSQIRNEIVELFEAPSQIENISAIPILKILEKLKEIHPEKYSEGYRRVYETEREATKEAKIMEGAQKVPQLLKKYKIISAIFTNNSLNTVELYQKKDGFEFLKEFYILTREDIKIPKPDPEGLLLIMRKFKDKNITKKNTVYIGDSFIDAIAAHRAGIRFIWFNSREIDISTLPAPPYATINSWDDFEFFLASKV